MSSNTHGRRRPPYTIQTAHHPGPDARIFTGPDAWERANLITDNSAEHYLMAVLPPGSSPDAFDWSVFSGREVLIEATGPTEANHALAVLLIHAGAIAAVVVDITGKSATPIESYRPRMAEVAA